MSPGDADGLSGGAWLPIYVVNHGSRSGEPNLTWSCSTAEGMLLVWQEYLTEPLSQTQKTMLEDLQDYGLVWQLKVWRHLPSLVRSIMYYTTCRHQQNVLVPHD